MKNLPRRKLDPIFYLCFNSIDMIHFPNKRITMQEVQEKKITSKRLL